MFGLELSDLGFQLPPLLVGQRSSTQMDETTQPVSEEPPEAPAASIGVGGDAVNNGGIPNTPATTAGASPSGEPEPAGDATPSGKEEPPQEKKLSKRDQIRKKLREKEKQLAEMMSRRNLNGRGLLIAAPAKPVVESAPQDAPTAEGSVEMLIINPDDKEEADRKEAVKVLSQAAVGLQDKLRKQKEEASGLQKQLENLDSTLQTREEEKQKLENELKNLREEVETNQSQMRTLEKALAERQTTLSSLEQGHEHYKEKQKDLQNQLSAAYEEVVWSQKDSMSKAEQIEYFEYELLAKNQEVDDLKQELNERLRRIVELEVELEIHDDRFSFSMDEYARSETGTAKSSAESVTREPQTPPPQSIGGRRKSGLGGILKFRKRGRNADSSSSVTSGGYEQEGSSLVVEKLQSDLSSLESRYKRDKYQSRMQIEQLKQENNEYLIKVLSLEKSLQKAQDGEGSANPLEQSPSTGEKDGEESKTESRFPNKMRFLAEKIESLENERDLQKQEMERLKAEMTELKASSASKAADHKLELEKLSLQGEGKAAKIESLELQLRQTGDSGDRSSLQGLHLNAAAGLESRLNDQFGEIVRLRKEVEVKDRKIEVLRSEIIELRLLRMQYEKASKEPGSGTSLEAISEEAPAVGAKGVVLENLPEDKLAWTRHSSERHAPIEQDVLSRINDMASLDGSIMTGEIRLQYHV